MDEKQNSYQQPDEALLSQTTPNIPALSSQAAASSPRRKKAPIDIDTALRLQSQASYVQEPARASPSSASTGSKTNQSNSATTSSTGTTTTTTTGAAGSTTALGQQLAPHATKPANTFAFHHADTTRQLSQQAGGSKQVAFSCPRDLDRATATNYYDHYYHGAATGRHVSQGNISVDYIDCLSNSDLTATSQQHPQQSAGTMRGTIPTTRKHPGHRFQRSHRIEPSDECPTGAPLAKQHRLLAGPAAPTNSSSGDESPPNAADARNQRAAGDDSSSLITCSNHSTDCSSSDQQLQATAAAAAASSSVLYPISVSEAKKRTYLIGSVSQDSLLGHDELLRYFPSGRVSIFVCTWNQNRKRAPLNLNDLLLPEQLEYVPDIYSVGIQEAYSSQQDYLREWEIELQTTLGPSHVLFHSCSLGSLHLALFVRRDLIWFFSTPEESLYSSRSMPTNMIKTKGAISIAFRFFGTSFMFTNCHFPAHENKLKDRIDEYQRIINSIDLPKNLKLLKPRYLSNDSTARFDCVFFMGDLNFRLEQRTFDETIQILDDIFQSRELSYEALTQNDELLKVMESQQAFHGFDESQIKFPPTYKFLAQTNKYDRQTRRVPSYTDRILFRSKRRRHIQCLVYDWMPQLMSSDHKPVFSLFDVLVRPGREQNMVSSMNAGLFQRAVYMEALRRRAEDPDGIRENGVGGNLICSIT